MGHTRSVEAGRENPVRLVRGGHWYLSATVELAGSAASLTHGHTGGMTQRHVLLFPPAKITSLPRGDLARTLLGASEAFGQLFEGAEVLTYLAYDVPANES